ncbi:MAG: hypothetical protein J7551_10935 [Chloroflexi bacterium]|nr:hypothetical protein [Chloroflexota bacterium]
MADSVESADFEKARQTLLELTAQAIRAPQMLSALQLQDAVQRAQQAQPRQRLPFQWRRGELIATAALSALLIALLLIANPQAEVIAQQIALRSAIEAQLERVEALKRDILANPELSEAEKQALAQILQELQRKMAQPNLTQLEAVAQLSQAAQQMNNARSQLTDRQRAALRSAGRALSQSPPMQGAAQAMQNGNLGDAAVQLQSLSRRVRDGQLTRAQIESMARALQQAAQALREANSAAAQAFQQAAQALQQGDLGQAAQALGRAAQALQSQQDQLAQSPLTQAAQRAAQALAQGSNQMAQVGRKGQGAQIERQGAQSGAQQGAQAEQQGSRAGQSAFEQQGGGAQQGAAGQQGDWGDAQALGQQTGAESAGQGSGGAGKDTTKGTPSDGEPVVAHKSSGDGALGDNEFIHAPSFINGEGGEWIDLRSDEALIEAGEFVRNPTGESRLPIREAVRRAAADANRAMESERVPSALRDLIRRYFTDLQR